MQKLLCTLSKAIVACCDLHSVIELAAAEQMSESLLSIELHVLHGWNWWASTAVEGISAVSVLIDQAT